MSSYKLRTDDLFDGDPVIENDYHQDFREGIQPPFTSTGTLIPLILCCLPLIYHILFLLDYDLLPLPELLWNCFVYVTPARLLDLVDNYQNPLRITNPNSATIPWTHAAKSEAMRRVLGLDKPGGIIGSVARAGGNRLSTLPGLHSGSQGKEGRPAGLGNWDSSCYQNSVLQGLASLDSLTGYLTNPKLEVSGSEGDHTDMKMAEALKGLISALNDPENNGRRVWTPASLKNMSSWQQQDAQEYFSKVLDEIDKEIGKVASRVQISQGLEANNSITPSSKLSGSLPVSTFRNPLEGLIAQRVGCTKCGFSEGLSMIPFNCLTVPLSKAWEHDIAECLDEYTKLELIEGVECGKCTLLKTKRLLSLLIERTKDSPDDARANEASKSRLARVDEALEDDDYEDKTLLQKCNINSKGRVSSTKSRQAVIARPPKSLVVHINRSLFDENTGELKKNYSTVKFPICLDLGSWCLGSSGTSGDMLTEEWLLDPDKSMIAGSRHPSRIRGPLYKIRGVVTHYGRHENGHYVCYRKHPVPVEEGEVPKEQWWRLSDDDVTKVSEEFVLGQGGVFMLFYDCIESVSPTLPEAKLQSIIAAEKAASEVEAVSQVPILKESPVKAEAAASIPLPEIDDGDLSDSEYQDSVRTNREASIATTISEFGDEDSKDENQVLNYKPTEAILVPQYVHQPGTHKDLDKAGLQDLTSGSLVMV